MGEIKWIEAKVTFRNHAGAMVQLLSDGVPDEKMPRIAVPTSALRDAPDSERVAELEGTICRLRQRSDAFEKANDQLAAERDKARQHAADLECELERVRLERDELKDAECKRLADELETIPKDDPEQPATQQHFREGDVVLVNGEVEVKVAAHKHTEQDMEFWATSTCDNLLLQPDSDVVLERDGIPTDARLERLAEKAGFSICARRRGIERASGHIVIDFEDRDIEVWGNPDDRQRCDAAAVLRAMGGA